MSESITRRDVNNERVEGKSVEQDVLGAVSRAARNNVRFEDLRLREGDDRTAFVAEMRNQAARLANLKIVERDEEEPVSAKEIEIEVAAAAIPEQEVQLDERLQALVVDAIDARHPDGIRVKGKKRTGVEIARAIPDVEAFLTEVSLQREDEVYLQREDGIFLDFFEVNADGQLVMKDDCSEAYGLGENALEARIRQTRVVYRDADGQTQVMTGKEYFTVTRTSDDGRPLEMKLSEKALSIDKSSILMQRGLPTLQWTGEEHVGEYARMNNGQLEVETHTWVDDEKLSGDNPRRPDFSSARYADWDNNRGDVRSYVYYSDVPGDVRGSRGVLRVNLNLGS